MEHDVNEAGTCKVAKNPDRLRQDEEAVGFVRIFVASGKPIGAMPVPFGSTRRWPGTALW